MNTDFGRGRKLLLAAFLFCLATAALVTSLGVPRPFRGNLRHGEARRAAAVHSGAPLSLQAPTAPLPESNSGASAGLVVLPGPPSAAKPSLLMAAAKPPASSPPPQLSKPRTSTAQMPINFQPNRGQAAGNVRFIARAPGYDIHLQDRALTFNLFSSPALPASRSTEPVSAVRETSVSFELLGASEHPQLSAVGELPGKANYLRSSDPATWITGVPTYAGVLYRDVYRGIDVVFHGAGNRLEYDFTVAPGADASQIAWQFDTSAVALADSGDLVLEAGGAELRFLKPVIYQSDQHGRQYVTGSYHLQPTNGGAMVRFDLGEYDHSRALIIDPVLSYSTSPTAAYAYIGSMATDSAGNAYLTSASGILQVTKLATDGATMLYQTSIGSNSGYSASATGAVVDNAGNLYLTGTTGTGFPTTATAYQPVSGSGSHAFLTVLDPTGSTLVYSTYLQGSYIDSAVTLALDKSGAHPLPVIAGFTYSTDFPNTSGVTLTGSQTAFVAKFDPTLSGAASLLYSTVVPATYSSLTQAVAADGSGNIYALLQAQTLTTTPGAFTYDGVYVGYGGVYVAKLNAAGVTQYLAYLGYGNAADIAADSSGNAYVVGDPLYADFPATTGAYQTTFPFGFLSVLNPSGSALVYSTFLSGPSGNVTPTSVAIPAGCASACNVYVGGFTTATDFPVTANAIQKMLGGNSDAFIVEVSGDGSSAPFSSYLGGTYDENIDVSYYYYYYYYSQRLPKVSLDGGATPNIFIAGNTNSPDFPLSAPGTTGGFVTKISPADLAIVIPNQYKINFPTQTINVASAPITLILRNYGSATATLSGFTTTPGFAQSNSCGGSIAGGSSCALQLTYTPGYPGPVSGTLTVNHDGTNNPTVIALAGSGANQPLVSVTPTALHFGTQAVNTSSATQIVTVTSTGTQPVTINSIYTYSGEPEFALTHNCPAALQPGASCNVAVTFSPLTVGYFSSTLYIQTNSANTSYFYVSLDGSASAGTGIGPSGLTPSTTALNFVDQAVGSASGTQYVYVYNTGTVPVTFGTPSITGANPADFSLSYNSCTVYAVVPSNSCTFGVIFKPTATGARSGTLTLPNSTGVPVVVSLAGNGVTAVGSLLFSPAALVFPDSAVGSTSTAQQIAVTNQGTTAVTIDRVFDSGNDFRVTSTSCITTVAPNGSSCYITVAFTPTAIGPITGSVTLVDDAPGSPQSIALSGNGVTAVETLVVSPSSVGFDDTVLGSSTYTYVYLYNPGNTDITISSLATSLPDFTVSNCTTVPAFSYCLIAVTFKPTVAGARSDTLVITDSAPGSPHSVPLLGNGLVGANSLEVSPLIVGFPDTVLGVASSQQAVTLYNPGNTNVNVTSPPTASGDFSVTNYCSIIYARNYCTDYVTFTPTQAGQRTGTFSIMDDAPNSPHTATLVGNGVSPFLEVIATPASLGFLDQVVGTTSSYSPIYFFNPGNTNVGVTNVAISGDFAIYSNGCATQIPAQSYCVEYVTFSPTGSGPRTGTLTITDTAAGSPHGVSLYGNGLAASASLTLTPTSMDFGNVLAGTASPAQALYLTNTGTQPVVVTSVTASNFFQGSGCVGTINAGTQCGISVTYTGSGTDPQVGNITVLDSSTGVDHAVQLTGTPVATTPAISISPNGLTFAQTVVGKTSTVGASFLNRSGATVTVTSVAPSPGDFALNSNNCGAVTNGSNCAVSVNFTPTASGVRTATLTFTYGTGSTITINLSGYAKAATTELVLTPSALAFPDQVVGSTSSAQLVYLWNQGTVPVSVSGNISITPADFAISSTSCNGANIQPASYCYAYVSFQPASATAITGALTINTVSDSTSPHVVTLTGNGVSPAKNLAFSATSLQFPDQPVGFPSAAQYFYLYNSGNTNVTLASKTANGDFAVSSDACGTTVYAHSSCYLYVTFTPTQTGLRSGSLDIADDATGNPHSIALSGNGLPATQTLTLSGTAMGFGDQPVGTTSAYQSVTAYNTGAAPVTFTASTINGDFSLQYNTCQSGSVQPKSYCTLYVVFQPSAAGTRAGSLTIHSSAGSYPVSLTGTGVAVVHAARVGSTAINFPDQAVGTTSAYQYLYLYNTGNVPLNVSSLNLSGDFGNPYSYTCSGVIAVNSYCYIYLTFTPTATGPRSGTLTIADDSAAGTHTVALSGNGVTPTKTLTLIPGNLQFLPQVIGATSSYLYVAVTSTGNSPITITGANVTDTIAGSGFALYSNGCSTLQAFGNQCYVYVTVTPTISGPLAGTLSITDTATGSPHTIALAGTGVATNQAVQLSQSSLTFGNQPIGTTSPVQYVYLVNQGATAVNITNLVVSGDYQVSGCGIGNYIYSTSSCVFYVYFKPTAAGSRPGSITITDTGAGSPRTITLNGTGVNPFPIATLSTSSMVFASQNIGSSSAYQYFYLTNTGTAPLNISSIAFAPVTTEFTLTPAGSCGATLAVNASCYTYVTFAPTNASGPGTRSATLVITDNDPSGTQAVNITGNALASSPLVALSPTSLSFGNQALNVTSTAQTVTLTNQGNAALSITGVAASSQFAVATNNCPASLNALANCAITVTFTPTANGPQSGTLTITDSAVGSPHIVGLTGTGVGSPSISLSPASLIFSNQQVGVASTQQAITVSNSGSAMLISSIGISAGDFAQTSNCPIQPSTLNTNGSCSIFVTFTPTAVGIRSATITINDNAGAGQQTVAVSGTGIGLPAVTLSPATSVASPLTFANQNVGTSSASQAVTLTNSGGGPLAINSIQASAGYAQTNNCGNNLDAGANCSINVSFVPTIIGTQAGGVSITDNAAGSPHSISATGVGLGGQPAFSPTSLDFGSVAVGTPTSSPSVTLTNSGNVPMNITGFQINNPPYSQTNNCPATLAANASCTITVVFNPTAAATQNGTLYVFTNGISGGTAALGLTGVGFGPVAGVSPASLSFGSVTVGTASPAQPITLSSTGSTALTISNITFSGSGDYSQTNTCPATLATGSNCTISVTFTPSAVGTRSGTLLIYDNTAVSPHQVALSGIGLGPAVTFNPPSLNFGTISLGTTSSSLTLGLTNSGTNALQISSITASSEFAQTNNCPSSLAASLSCTISVTFTPAAPGTRNGSITVVSNAGTQSAALTGVGNGPQVQLAPPSLSFGSLPVGLTSAPQPVVLTNSGNAALTITSIVPSTDFAESDNCPATLGAGSFCTLNVTFKPSVIGPENGAITITDSAGGSPHHVALSGTGTGAQTDLAVTGTVIPATILPGGSFTYTFVVTNGGPSPATGVALNVTLPPAANATLNSVNTTAGACTGNGPLACAIGNLASGSAATVTIAMTATAVASFPATGTASGNETDPNNSNNSLTLTSAVLAADLAIVGASAPTTVDGTPAYTMMVTNNGPSTATNVSMTCAYNRYQYVAYSAPNGTCTYSGASLTCSLGTLAVGVSTGVTQLVQPPNTGWGSITCHASSDQLDPNPTNNSAEISPSADSFNTTSGNNVSVQLADLPSGTLARVTFSKVTQPGTTSLTRTDGATAPAGFRTGSLPATFDLSTSALYNAPVTESFGFSPAQFHKPAQVHLFHMEGGAWVDRTVGMDPSSFTVSALTVSLSPFALFEPVNHPPTANVGADRTVSGTSVVGASVALDGSLSSDPDGDSLTYRWTGPFPEGNGVVTGAKPSVTLPFGTSKVTLVVNDGEADSAPAAVNVAVSDFVLALTPGSASLKRGQSTTLNLSITPKGGSFDQPVTLGCANLPASMTCQFSPPSVQPGANGASTVLTLASSGLAQGRPAPRPLWAMWTGLFGVLGIVVAGARRGRGWTLLLIVLALTAILYTGCGGGGMTSAPQNNSTPSTTVTITITGSSGGLQHSTTANVTVD